MLPRGLSGASLGALERRWGALEHSWGAFGLANPHHALGDAISKFVEKADEYTSKGPKTSYNVGVINGGTSIKLNCFTFLLRNGWITHYNTRLTMTITGEFYLLGKLTIHPY